MKEEIFFDSKDEALGRRMMKVFYVPDSIWSTKEFRGSCPTLWVSHF